MRTPPRPFRVLRIVLAILGLASVCSAPAAAQASTPAPAQLCCAHVDLRPGGRYVTRLVRTPESPSHTEVRAELQVTLADGTGLDPFEIKVPAGAGAVTFTNSHAGLEQGGRLSLIRLEGAPAAGLTGQMTAELLPPPTVSFSSTNVTMAPWGSAMLRVRISRRPLEPGSVVVRQTSGEQFDYGGMRVLPLEDERTFGPTHPTVQEVYLGYPTASDASFVLESRDFVVGSNATAWVKGRAQFQVETPSFASPGGIAAVELRRTDSYLGKEVELHWETAAGTAQVGRDYLGTHGVLHFGPEDRSLRVLVPVLPTAVFGSSFGVRFRGTNARFPDGAFARVEVRPTVSLSDTRYEVDAAGDVVIGFKISQPAAEDIEVSMGAGGIPLRGRIPAGQLDGHLTLRTENMVRRGTLTLSSAYGTTNLYSVGYPGSAHVFPRDVGGIQVEVTPAVAPEGQSLVFHLRRTGDLLQALRIRFSTSAGTATPGEDFLHRESEVRFAPGQHEARITLDTYSDSDAREPSETLKLLLSSEDSRVRFAGEPIGTIENAGESPWVPSPSGDEGMVLEVSYYNIPEGTRFFTQDGLAKAGIDYEPVSGMLAAGHGTLRIPLLDDGNVEVAETFHLRYVLPSDPSLTNTVELSIQDNELPTAPDWEIRLEDLGGCCGFVAGIVRRDDSMVISLGNRLVSLDPNGGLQTIQDLAVDVREFAELSGGDLLLRTDSELNRLSRDGTLQPFRIETPTGEVTRIATTPDGHVLVGLVTPFSGAQLIRLREDGTRDPSFRAPSEFPSDRLIRIAHAPDGVIHLVRESCVRTSCRYAWLRLAGGKLSLHESLYYTKFNVWGIDRLGRSLRAGADWNGHHWVRRNANGALDEGFVTGPLHQETHYVGTQSDGAVIVFGSRETAQWQGKGRRLFRIPAEVRQSPAGIRTDIASDLNEASQVLVVRLSRTGSSLLPATVRVRTSDGTALAGADYEPVDTIVHFAALQVTNEFRIPLRQDRLAEGGEFLRLNLSELTPAAEIPLPQEIAVIADDEPPLTLSVARTETGAPMLRVLNPFSRRVQIESSDDLVHWTPLITRSSDHIEVPVPADPPSRFYRALIARP